MCVCCLYRFYFCFCFLFRWWTLKSTEIEPIRNNEKVCFLTLSNDDDYYYKHYRYSCEFCFVYYEKLILNRILFTFFFVVVVPISNGHHPWKRGMIIFFLSLKYEQKQNFIRKSSFQEYDEIEYCLFGILRSKIKIKIKILCPSHYCRNKTNKQTKNIVTITITTNQLLFGNLNQILFASSSSFSMWL